MSKSVTLGEKIKELRKEKGLSQEDLANKLGTTYGQISRYENDHVLPAVEMVIKLSEIFEVSTDYLLKESAPKAPLHQMGSAVIEKCQAIQLLDSKDQESIFQIIDGLVTKAKFQQLVANKA